MVIVSLLNSLVMIVYTYCLGLFTYIYFVAIRYESEFDLIAVNTINDIVLYVSGSWFSLIYIPPINDTVLYVSGSWFSYIVISKYLCLLTYQ